MNAATTVYRIGGFSGFFQVIFFPSFYSPVVSFEILWRQYVANHFFFSFRKNCILPIIELHQNFEFANQSSVGQNDLSKYWIIRRKKYMIRVFLFLFQGMGARVLYQMPSTAICWTVYEFFKYFLTKDAAERSARNEAITYDKLERSTDIRPTSSAANAAF